MTLFWRAIAVSSAVHGALLGYAFAVPAVGEADLDVQPKTYMIAETRVAERLVPTRKSEKSPEESAIGELASMDLREGLDGSPESDPSAEPDSPPEPEPPESESPEPEPTRPDPPEPEPSESESTEPEPTQSDPPEPEEPKETSEPDPDPEPRETEKTSEPVRTPSERRKSESDDRPSESDDSSDSPDENDTPEAEEASDDSERDRVATKSETGGESAGSGGGSSAESDGSGSGGGEGSGAGRSGIDRGALIRGYTRKLYRRFAREKYYPRAARRAGIEGTVHLEITIDGTGKILSVDLHESSGFDVLDRAAVEAMRALQKLPAPPKALAWNRKRLRVPIRYSLDT